MIVATERERLIELIKQKQDGGSKYRDHILNETKCSNAELADFLLENGVIVLPCKAYSTCFVINDFLKTTDKIILGTIVGFGVYKDGMTMYISYTNESISDERLVSDFGKTVFLTREEAEMVLAERSEHSD